MVVALNTKRREFEHPTARCTCTCTCTVCDGLQCVSVHALRDRNRNTCGSRIACLLCWSPIRRCRLGVLEASVTVDVGCSSAVGLAELVAGGRQRVWRRRRRRREEEEDEAEAEAEAEAEEEEEEEKEKEKEEEGQGSQEDGNQGAGDSETRRGTKWTVGPGAHRRQKGF
ncbi:hypothetical protein RJ55_00202 [Drechmeria coniospora]|nr:hypothetical protein RJ55_00202 [Drechmeria coniospora]